jgi:hypothetical protein
VIRLGALVVVVTLAFQPSVGFAGDMQSRIVVHSHFGDAAHEFGCDGIEALSDLEDGPIILVVSCFAVSDKYIVLVDHHRNELKIYAADATYQRNLEIHSILGLDQRFVVMDVALNGSSIYLLQDRSTGVRTSPEMDTPRFVVYRYDTATKVTDLLVAPNDPFLGTIPPTEYGPRQRVVGTVSLYISSGQIALYDKSNRMTYFVGPEAADGLRSPVPGWSIPAGVVQQDEDNKLTVLGNRSTPVYIGAGSIRTVSSDGNYLAVVNFGTFSVVNAFGNLLGSFQIPRRHRVKYAPVPSNFELVSTGETVEVYECYVSPDGVFVLSWDTLGGVNK